MCWLAVACSCWLRRNHALPPVKLSAVMHEQIPRASVIICVYLPPMKISVMLISCIPVSKQQNVHQAPDQQLAHCALPCCLCVPLLPCFVALTLSLLVQASHYHTC